jgi:hypothetical protein
MRQAQPDDDALMEMGTTADRIRLAYDEALGPLLSAGDAFPCRSRVAYGDWLAQTYHYLFHTTRLIALAASRCDAHHGRSGTGTGRFLALSADRPAWRKRGRNVQLRRPALLDAGGATEVRRIPPKSVPVRIPASWHACKPDGEAVILISIRFGSGVGRGTTWGDVRAIAD